MSQQRTEASSPPVATCPLVCWPELDSISGAGPKSTQESIPLLRPQIEISRPELNSGAGDVPDAHGRVVAPGCNTRLSVLA